MSFLPLDLDFLLLLFALYLTNSLISCSVLRHHHPLNWNRGLNSQIPLADSIFVSILSLAVITSLISVALCSCFSQLFLPAFFAHTVSVAQDTALLLTRVVQLLADLKLSRCKSLNMLPVKRCRRHFLPRQKMLTANFA